MCVKKNHLSAQDALHGVGNTQFFNVTKKIRKHFIPNKKLSFAVPVLFSGLGSN